MSSTQLNDGVANVITGLNAPGSKQGSSYYVAPLGDQLQQASNAYRTSWLMKRCIDIPAFEMTRAGRDWQAERAEIEKLEKEEARLNLWPKLREAIVGGDQGGAAIILGDGARDPMRPIKEGGLKSLKYIHVAYRSQLTLGDMETDIESDNFGQPAWFELNQGNGKPSIRLHHSRVIPFKGAPAASAGIAGVSNADAFWGDPVWASLQSVVTNADVAQAGVSALVHEAKNDVVTVPGLKDILTSEQGDQMLIRRFTLANQLKNATSTTIIDGGDPNLANSGETWDTRQLSFGTLPELMQTFVGFVAGARGIPKTILLGDTPGGLNTTGKGEQREFERRIEAQQEAVLRPALERIDPLLIASALGSVPAEIHWMFAPLSSLSEVEESEVNKRNAETTQIYVNTGLIPVEALAKGVQNKLIEDGVYPGLDSALDEAEGDDLELPEGDEDDPALIGDAEPRPLYVQRKLINTKEFLDWAKSQGFSETLAADDLHVTVLYSRAPVDWMKMGETWTGDKGNLTVNPGGARIVEPLGDKGAIVLLFASSELTWRHGDMIRNGASHDYDEYQPHVTITYAGKDVDLSKVEPYRGKLEFGPEIFEELNTDWTPNIGDAISTDDQAIIAEAVARAENPSAIRKLLSWAFGRE